VLIQRAYLFNLYSFFVVLSSWIRWYSTGTLKADDNFIDQSSIALWSCVLFYHIGVYGMMYTLYNIVWQKPNYKISQAQTLKICLISMFIFFFMSVMFAADIYTYLAEGELWTRGILTYTNGDRVKESKFIEYVSHWWRNCPNHYGSPLLFIFGISCYIGQTIFKSYLIFKLVVFLFGLAYVKLVSKLENTMLDKQYNFFALLTLSPIFLIEGIGQVHVELIIAFLLAAFMLTIHQKKIYVSAIFIGLAIACKILYIIILLPLFLSAIYVFHRSYKLSWISLFKKWAIGVGIIGVVILISYIPIWEGMETITNPMAYHNTKTPSRSYTEIIILINRYFSEFLNNGFSIQKLIASAQMPDFLPISNVIYLKNKIAPFFASLGLVLAAWNLIPLIRVKEVNSVYYYFAKLWIIIIVIYSPIFNPWYFMPIILLMFYHRKASWIFYLVVVTSISMNYQIGNTTPPNSILNIVGSVQMILTLLLFMNKFYSHFILEPFLEIKALIKK
jgi:hypothetical protein